MMRSFWRHFRNFWALLAEAFGVPDQWIKGWMIHEDERAEQGRAMRYSTDYDLNPDPSRRIIPIPGSFPRIVCLCGSTRFSEAFRVAALSETLAMRIVLTIGDMMQSDDDMGLTRDDKRRLDELHLRKIDLADEILVLNVGGYVGESTAREIAYARQQHKAIRFLEATP